MSGTLATLRWLLARYGDVTVTEALELQRAEAAALRPRPS